MLNGIIDPVIIKLSAKFTERMRAATYKYKSKFFKPQDGLASRLKNVLFAKWVKPQMATLVFPAHAETAKGQLAQKMDYECFIHIMADMIQKYGSDVE